MSQPAEFLVISRGQWDPDAPKEEIQTAIDDFYAWLGGLIDEGKMKPGERLGTGGAMVTREQILTDGPFGEAKEVIGGYWFIRANSLAEAAQLAAGNPCLQYGLRYEIRPLALEKASAFDVTNETPVG